MPGDSANTATGSSGHVPLGFGGLHASVGDHIGHFYEAKDGWKDVLDRSETAALAMVASLMINHDEAYTKRYGMLVSGCGIWDSGYEIGNGKQEKRRHELQEA
jgi:hypothetical protein